MKLTKDNYYSLEADRYYMSNSLWKKFMECEAQAVAKLAGKYTEPQTEALLIGQYVHSAIEGVTAQTDFIERHPQMFCSTGKNKGELKAEYRHADKMVQMILDDQLCRQMIREGKSEVIVTAELFGVMWKAKIDVLAEDRIVDLKTVKCLRDKYWLGDRFGSFVESYGYLTQMSVYTELERLSSGRTERLEPFIVAVSKESVPDKCVIMFDDATLDAELAKVAEKLPRVMAVKNGEVEPKRCEKCEWCRSTKRAEIVHFMSLLEGA